MEEAYLAESFADEIDPEEQALIDAKLAAAAEISEGEVAAGQPSNPVESAAGTPSVTSSEAVTSSEVEA